MEDAQKTKAKMTTGDWYTKLKKFNNEFPVKSPIHFGRMVRKKEEIYRTMFLRYKITKGPDNKKMLCIEIKKN